MARGKGGRGGGPRGRRTMRWCALALVLTLPACEYTRYEHRPHGLPRGGSILVSAPMMDGAGHRCFRLPRALLPSQGDDGFIFRYSNLDYLTGASASPGEIGTGRGPFGVVSVNTKDLDEMASFPTRDLRPWTLLVEEDSYVLVQLHSGHPRMYTVDRTTGLSIDVLKVSVGMNQLAQLRHESEVVEDFVMRAEVAPSACVTTSSARRPRRHAADAH